MKLSFEVKIARVFAQAILWFASFFNDNNLVLVCKGYDGDYDLYTGLYWDDDKYIDFKREVDYEDFRLWINL